MRPISTILDVFKTLEDRWEIVAKTFAVGVIH